jgi:hypothetical protein
MPKHSSKKQGYNDKLDESLGMRRGKESSKKQSLKDRRDESKGMEKAEGRRAYASVKSMDINGRMKAHAKKHGIDMRHKHMRLMKKYVGEGMSFTKAHNRAQKEAPVNKDE